MQLPLFEADLFDRGFRERFFAKVEKTDGCWAWTGATMKGYGYCKVTWSEGRVSLLAHRTMYALHTGVSPGDLQCHHVCENKLCVNPDHISLLSPSEHGKLHNPVAA